MDEASARMLTSLNRPGGAVAQLGARLDGIEEVVGSNPIGSTRQTWVTECTGYIVHWQTVVTGSASSIKIEDSYQFINTARSLADPLNNLWSS